MSGISGLGVSNPKSLYLKKSEAFWYRSATDIGGNSGAAFWDRCVPPCICLNKRYFVQGHDKREFCEVFYEVFWYLHDTDIEEEELQKI